MAVGMAADLPHHLLFVAGGFGQAHVYDTRTGATVASYQFADPAASIVNDVAVTRHGAWFTDSLQAQLYFVPVSRAGVPGPFRTLGLSGPAADTGGEFNLNGIQATTDGKTLIVAHSTNGRLYTVDPASGASAAIAGVGVPRVDGIVLEAEHLWAVQTSNQVSRIRLRPDLGSGVVERVITGAGSSSRPPRPASAVGWRWSTRSSTCLPPNSTRWSWSTPDPVGPSGGPASERLTSLLTSAPT
jgi:sugar lactone lactonase YvrE